MTYHSRNVLQFDGASTPFGINLGYDHCAEHEWGISGLSTILQLQDHLDGLDRYRARKMTTELMERHVHFEDRKKSTKAIPASTTLLVHAHTWVISEHAAEGHRSNYKPAPRWRDEAFTACWDEKGFIVSAYTDEARAIVRDLHAALQEGDFLLSRGGSNNPFGGSGLCLSIASRIPQTAMDAIAKDHLAARQLQEAADATGIATRLAAAGRKYFALSPRWFSDPEGDGARQVKFWLNPYDQRAYNFGWFTVADLDDWIAGRGPVIKG